MSSFLWCLFFYFECSDDYKAQYFKKVEQNMFSFQLKNVPAQWREIFVAKIMS